MGLVEEVAVIVNVDTVLWPASLKAQLILRLAVPLRFRLALALHVHLEKSLIDGGGDSPLKAGYVRPVPLRIDFGSYKTVYVLDAKR